MKFLENDFKRIFSLVNENKSDLAIDELNTFYSSNKKDKNVLFLLSLAYLKLKNFKQALNFIKKALTNDKSNFDYLSLQGMVYSNLKEYNNALKIYDRLILNYPNNPSAYEHKFTLLRKINRPREKINFLNHIKNLKHLNFKYIESHLIDTELEILDWSNFEEKKNMLKKSVLNNEEKLTPFLAKLLYDDPDLDIRSAKIYSNFLYEKKANNNFTQKYNNNKINLGFFSFDFTNHPTTFLIMGLFKFIDKKKFTLNIFYYGDNFSIQTDEIKKYADNFFEISGFNDDEVKSLAINQKIDIAFDLNGYTNNHRAALFFKRLAPIQINYLAFPGTLGSDAYDYMIVDHKIVNENNKNYFSEKLIYMPNVYQINDYNNYSEEINKNEFDINSNEFVFSNFGSQKKINPEITNAWIKILKSTHKSKLYLMIEDNISKKNLKEFFKDEKIFEKVHFTKKINYFAHMKRFQSADLFLDTYPCGSHTTASESLFMGLPILSIVGKSIQSRVSYSFLKSLDLEYLICQNIDEYVSKAIELYNDPKKLKKIKQQLNNSKKNVVFDPKIYTKNFSEKIESLCSNR